MANGYDILEMCQGSQNQPATQWESCTQNKQMTAEEYILVMEEMF